MVGVALPEKLTPVNSGRPAHRDAPSALESGVKIPFTLNLLRKGIESGLLATVCNRKSTMNT